MGIQMNQKKLTKTFMIISNLIKPFGLHGLYKNIQRFNPAVIYRPIKRIEDFYNRRDERAKVKINCMKKPPRK